MLVIRPPPSPSARRCPSARHDKTVLIVPVVSGGDDDAKATVVANPFLDAEAVGEIEVALESLGAKGGTDQVTRVVAPSLPVASVLAVGLGKARDNWPSDLIRRAAGVAARSLNGTEAVITTLSDIDLEAAIEGLDPRRLPVQRLPQRQDRAERQGPARDHRADGGHQRPRPKPKRSAPPTSRRPSPPHAIWSTLRRRTCSQTNSPSAQRLWVKRPVSTSRCSTTKTLAKEGYGGVIGVGKGSSRPPRLVRLAHRGAKNKKAKRVALVGKGITFDTGGISIKPAANMHHMTSDMGGAAAVIATVVLAAQQKLPIDVIATVPMAENMPSATAQRPGDVLTQYGGITVEVLNTDAEGRLILADAIVRACEDNPDYLIETSTLTGAQTVALGARTPGVMGSDEFRDRVANCPRRSVRTLGPCRFPRNSRTT